MTDLIARAPSTLEASTAVKAAQDEVVKAEQSLLMAVEFAGTRSRTTPPAPISPPCSTRSPPTRPRRQPAKPQSRP